MKGKIWAFLVSLMFLMVGSSGITPREREYSDMPINWELSSVVSVSVNSGQNAPFCYTYPDTANASAKIDKLTITLRYYDPMGDTYTNRTYNSSSTPSIGTIVSSTTASYTTSGTFNLPIDISVFYNVGVDTFDGTLTSTVSIDVYQNQLISVSMSSSATPKTTYLVGESLVLDGIIVDAVFTHGTITGIDLPSQCLVKVPPDATEKRFKQLSLRSMPDSINCI